MRILNGAAKANGLCLRFHRSYNEGMNIAQVSEQSGLTPRMIRHYEAIGLVPRPDRTSGNYRAYDEADVARLKTVAAARTAGFSMDDIRGILDLCSGTSNLDGEATIAYWMKIIAARQSALDQVKAALSMRGQGTTFGRTRV